MTDEELTKRSSKMLKQEQGLKEHNHPYAKYPLLSGTKVKEDLKDGGKRDPSLVDAEKW
eukprot:UN00445